MDVRDVSIPEPQDRELLIRVHPTRDFAFPFVTGIRRRLRSPEACPARIAIAGCESVANLVWIEIQ
jgi:hypothetical protein